MPRTLFLTKNRTIDPLSLQLLVVYRAVFLIMSMGTAGTYIDTILEDLDKGQVVADRTTELGHLNDSVKTCDKDCISRSSLDEYVISKTATSTMPRTCWCCWYPPAAMDIDILDCTIDDADEHDKIELI